jgi:hypothetical protein
MKTLKIFALTLVPALMSGAALAEWVQYDYEATFVAYADLSTIRKKGNMATMWVMITYTEPRVTAGTIHQSVKYHEEYNCAEGRSRPVATVAYSLAHVEGDVVHSDTEPSAWSPVVPGTRSELVWRIACGKVKLI